MAFSAFVSLLDQILQVAPVVGALLRLIEDSDLWRAVGRVIGVAVGHLHVLKRRAPTHIVAADDVALVESAAILGEEHIGQLVLGSDARVGDPLFDRVVWKTGQFAPARDVAVDRA